MSEQSDTPITDRLAVTILDYGYEVTSEQITNAVQRAVAPLERSHAELLAACKGIAGLPYLIALKDLIPIYAEAAARLKAGDSDDHESMGQMMLQLVSIAEDAMTARSLAICAAESLTKGQGAE